MRRTVVVTDMQILTKRRRKTGSRKKPQALLGLNQVPSDFFNVPTRPRRFV
jgi:hypothetical protein